MKIVTLKSKHGEVGEYTMIDTPQALLEYLIYMGAVTTNKLTSVFKSKVDPSRWDHLITKDLAGSMLAGGWIDASVNGGNPLLKMAEHLKSKELNFIKLIEEGEIILVNRVGGYCTFREDYYTILEERKVDVPKHYIIKENTKYINLENDPQLEKHSIEYLKTVDPNYSYITNLSVHTFEDLIDIFCEFVEAGGDTIYVYTTGMNIEQMYEYTEAAALAGISNIEFEFNAGISNEIQAFLDDATSPFNVKIIGI